MLCALFFWSLFGWLADYSFPFGQAIELMLACFKNTVSAKVTSFQKQLQQTDVVPQPNNRRQVQRLNNLESQAWLYEGILERLGTDPSVNHEKIARTLEALEYKRSEILQELEPRRPKSYRVLAGLQDSARILLASQAESDYEQLQKIVTNLIIFTRSKKSSQVILSDAITKLATEITQNTDKISPYRLRLAYRIDELMRILSAKLILNSNTSETDSSYQSLINELRSRIRSLSKEFNNLLESRQKDRSELRRSIREIENLTKNISDLHREISNRDADIVALQRNIRNLTGSIQEKQAQIDSLQSSIRSLQRDIQNSAEFNNEKQAQLNHLQNQLSYLNQQESDLKSRIRILSTYNQNKESEVESLQNERSRLSSQKLELQRQNRALNQHCQHQKYTIDSLNERIGELSRANRAQSQASSKTVATQEKISEAEYTEIINKDEYEYVRGYTNSRSGKLVAPYYRRKKRR